MAQRKQYPLRIDPLVWEAIQKWAADDMRSANGQVEFILRWALREAGRLPGASGDAGHASADKDKDGGKG